MAVFSRDDDSFLFKVQVSVALTQMPMSPAASTKIFFQDSAGVRVLVLAVCSHDGEIDLFWKFEGNNWNYSSLRYY